jgi:hypothetical protein
MILGTIGTILGAAGNVASGVMSAINNKKARQSEEAEAARQQAHYDALANEDPLSRASNQRLLNEYDREAQQQVEKARNVAAITGATPEYGLAVQKGVAEGRADLMGNIAANNEATRQKAIEAGEQAKQRAALQELARIEARNQSYANLAANASNAASSLISGMQPKKVTNYKGEIDYLNNALSAGAITQDQYNSLASKVKSDWNKQLTGNAVQ